LVKLDQNLQIYRFTEFTFAWTQQKLPLYRFIGEIYQFTDLPNLPHETDQAANL